MTVYFYEIILKAHTVVPIYSFYKNSLLSNLFVIILESEKARVNSQN